MTANCLAAIFLISVVVVAEVAQESYKNCNLGRRPSDAVVTRAGNSNTDVNILLLAAYKLLSAKHNSQQLF
jgi:hypothetical protein